MGKLVIVDDLMCAFFGQADCHCRPDALTAAGYQKHMNEINPVAPFSIWHADRIERCQS